MTRHPLLGAWCGPRIAPLAALCARAGHESLRVTDRSAINTLELRTAYGSLRTRHLVLLTGRGGLRLRRLALCTSRGLLRVWYWALHDGLRIAPYAEHLAPLALFADISALRTLRSAPCTDYSVLDAWRFALIADCSALFAFAPCVDRGFLRAQHFELCSEPVVLRVRNLSLCPEPGLLPARHLAICAPHGFLRASHLSPYVSCRLLGD